MWMRMQMRMQMERCSAMKDDPRHRAARRAWRGPRPQAHPDRRHRSSRKARRHGKSTASSERRQREFMSLAASRHGCNMIRQHLRPHRSVNGGSRSTFQAIRRSWVLNETADRLLPLQRGRSDHESYESTQDHESYESVSQSVSHRMPQLKMTCQTDEMVSLAPQQGLRV